MVLKTMAVAAGACALVAGAAVAGSAAHASPSAPAAPLAQAQAAAPDADLASLATDAATADAAGAAVKAGVRGPHKLCARVPQAITRTQNLEKRLAADVSTPGSLAYLQHRIDAAQAAHETQLVTRLTNRLTYRKQLAVFLPQRLTLLQTAQRTVCAPAPGTSPTS